MWMFKKVGRVDITIPKDASTTEDRDEILDVAFGSGMEDFDIVDGDELDGKQLIKLYCPPERIASLATAVSAHSFVELQERKIVYIPETPSESSLDDETQEKLRKLLERILADEDTLNIWTTTDEP